MEVEAAAEEPEAEVLMHLMLEVQQEELEYLVKYQDLSLLEAEEAVEHEVVPVQTTAKEA